MLWLFLLPFFVFAQETVPSITIASAPSPITNPSSGVYLNEFMPNPEDNDEWVEIINTNNSSIKIEDWKIGDFTTHTKSIGNTEIAANAVYAFPVGSSFLNNGTDSVKLIDNNDKIVEQYNYSSVDPDKLLSWSKIDGKWCLAVPSPNSFNNSCYVPTPSSTPTPTITPTNTPTPTVTPIPTSTPVITSIPLPTDTPLPILTPVLEDTPTYSANPASSMLGNILGATSSPTDGSGTSSRFANLLPLIFIIAGGILLATPLIISQIKTHWLPKK